MHVRIRAVLFTAKKDDPSLALRLSQARTAERNAERARIRGSSHSVRVEERLCRELCASKYASVLNINDQERRFFLNGLEWAILSFPNWRACEGRQA